MENYLLLPLLLLVIHFSVSYFIIWLVYRIFKKLIYLLKTPIAGTNNTSLNLFLSFGITLIFFNEMVLSNIVKIWSFVISPFDSIGLIKNNIRTTFLSNSFNDANVEVNFSGLVFDWGQNFKSAFISNILYFNYTGIIIFLTFWLLISLLFREIEQSSKIIDGSEKEGKISNFAENTTVKNIFTILILIFSIYLSVSSMIAVSEFQDPEKIKSEEAINLEFKDQLEKEKMLSKDMLLIQKDSILTNNVNIAEFDEVLIMLRNATSDYNHWVTNQWTEDERTKNIAINRFKSAADSKMRSKDRIEFKLALADWYLSFHYNWAMPASFFKSNLILAKENIKDILGNKDYMRFDTIRDDSTKYFVELNINASSRLDGIADDLRDFASRLYSGKNINSLLNVVPQKPQPGDNFGIFKTISGWLLRTDSLPLALIVGLFGFGLLGSIGSTFIRRRIRNVIPEEDNDTIVVYDLQGIIINGISAAIVVFLAVKGVVIVFSKDGGDNLNPYILFFTCLVASVFSEDVWGWARTKLNQNLGNNQSTKEEESNEGNSISKNKGEVAVEDDDKKLKGSGSDPVI